MPIIWDKERISKLSIQELKNLKINATDSGRSEIVELIDEELKSRPSPRARSSKVRAHDIPRSRFETLGKTLLQTYDLSEETARKLSEDVKGFRPHNLLGKNGKAKTGGARKKGNNKLDEYISYRLKDDVYILSLIQFKDDADDYYRYHVYASEELVEGAKDIKTIRPDIDFDVKVTHGIEFGDFDSASELFVTLLDKIAPKRE